MMRVGISLTIPGLGADEILRAAVAADDNGAELITFGEAQFDPLVLGAAAAGRVTAPLASGIARWDRDPSSLARSATTVAELSGQVYRLGVGTGPIRGFDAASGAVDRMRKYVRELRSSLNGRDDVAIELAAARPGMARLAGAEGDGVLLSRVHTVDRLRRTMLPAISDGEAGQRRITRSLLVRCAVTATEEEGIDVIRRAVAVFELPLIADLLADEGTELAEAIRHREAGRLDAAAAAVPEELVRQMALVGPAEACLDQMRRYDGHVDLVSLFPCGSSPQSAVAGAFELLRLTAKVGS